MRDSRSRTLASPSKFPKLNTLVSTLEIESEGALNIEMNWKCRMNEVIFMNKKEVNYKCQSCGLICCQYCIENCHRNHRSSRKYENLRNDVTSFVDFPCQCALAKHAIKPDLFANLSNDESASKARENGRYCKNNLLICRSSPKYYYKRKEDNLTYCLYCINNFAKLNDYSRKTVSIVSLDSSTNMEKFDSLNEFYCSYEKVPYKEGDPIPNCFCDNVQHKHESQLENVVNFINFINANDKFHYINIIKMTYQLFNDITFVEEHFSEFSFIQGIINNAKEEFKTGKYQKGEIIFRDLRDWTGYFKTFWFFSTLLNNISSINNCWLCLGYEMRNYFGYEMVHYILSTISNQQGYWFKIQTKFIRMYRKFYIPNQSLSQFLSLQENISPIHRLLFSIKSDNLLTNQNQSNADFLNQNLELVDKLFAICNEMNSSKKLSTKEYNEMVIECLKFINALLPYCYYDIKMLKKLFKKVKVLVAMSKDKKESLNQVIHVTEHISLMILTYINDYKFYKKILAKKGGAKQLLEDIKDKKLVHDEMNWSFQYSKLSNSIITTLFSLDLTIHEQIHYIENYMFYDNLLNENDFYIEPLISAIGSNLVVKMLNDKKNDVAIVDIVRGKVKKVLKDNPYIEASFVPIRELYNEINKDLFSMFESDLSEEDFIDHMQIFLNKLKDLLNDDLCNDNNQYRFINQILFVKEQYFSRLFDLINISQSIQTYQYNIEGDKPVLQIQIGKITSSLQSKLKTVLLYITKENPLIASLLLSKEYIDLILLKQSSNLDFYLTMLKKVFVKSKYYINLDDLVKYILENFVSQIMNSIKNNIPVIETILQIFKYILSISSKKSVMVVNNKIATTIGMILEHAEFKGIITLQIQTNDQYNKIVSSVFNCVNKFQNEYMYLLVPKIDITTVTNLLLNLDLQPNLRRCLARTYMKYFIIGNIKKDDEQGSSAFKSIEQRERSLKPIIECLRHYQVYYVKHKVVFTNNLKLMLSFFQDIVFEPCLNAIHSVSYFSQVLDAELKYTLYSIIYLFLESLQMTLNNLKYYDLNSKANINSMLKFIVDVRKIGQMKENVSKTLEMLQGQQCQLLDINMLFNIYIQSIHNFVYYQKYCVENSNYTNISCQRQIDNVITLSVLVEEAANYLKDKSNYESNNVLKEIFTNDDESLSKIRYNITIDLLYKLNYNKKEHTVSQDMVFNLMNNLKKGMHKIFRFDSIRHDSPLKHSTSLSKNASGFKCTISQSYQKKKTTVTDTSLGEFYKPYINTYIEGKTSFIESIDKLFKSNPGLWQQLIVDNFHITKHIINIFIEKQLPFLINMIFLDFNRLDTIRTPYYDAYLYILEFLRLLCEDHNPVFQTLLINYEKAARNDTIESKFICSIFNLSCSILRNIKHTKSKFNILSLIKVINWDYFEPLSLKASDFLIEIIQGTYTENFNDLATAVYQYSKVGFTEYIDLHYQYLNHLDANEEYEYPLAQFFRFINCFIEEHANPLNVKVSVITTLNPKKLSIFGFDAYKKLYFKYLNEKVIQTDSHLSLLEKFIKSDSDFLGDSLFTIATGIFVYLKRVNSYKVKGIGDQFTQILSSLQLLSEANSESEENSSKLIRKEYYKFCNILIKDNEISFAEDKYKGEKEIDRYRNFFCNEYKTDVLDVRNENSKLKTKYDTIFFMIHPDSLYLTKRDTAQFVNSSSCTTVNGKLNSILDYYPELSNRIEMRKMLSDHKFLLFLFKLHYANLEKFNAFCCLFINLLILLLVNENITLAFAYTHLLWVFLLIINWFIFNTIKYIKSKEEPPTFFAVIHFINSSIFNMEIFCFIWTFLWGVLGVSFRVLRFLFSLQLFTFFKIVPTMASVIYAVKVRYKQFLSTAFLLVILILFYSSVTFYYFRVKDDGSLFCGSYLECFLLLFNNGIRSGGMAFEMKTKSTPGYWSEFIYSWIFYFIIILIILNIINGIIVDTFQALREQNNEIDEEKLNVCFICSLKRSAFEMKGIDFAYHTSFEHNIENYFKYITKILRTDEHDLNSIDFQVFNAIQQHKIEFFPIKKAKSLDMQKN